MEIDVDMLLRGLDRRGWLPLQHPGERRPMVPAQLPPAGAGVLVSSGGSSGGRQVCLQPWSHLDQSANATANWLEGVGVDPAEALLLNPLPLHHISGLMPWWRSRCWGARHVQLTPSLMKAPADLLQVCERLPDWGIAPVVVSLVPTQLHRLMADPAGLAWLQVCAVIWVGGAALPESLADQARSHGLRLSPSYGATETAAMVAVQTPERFLAGQSGCGIALNDVELRLDADQALLVRTPRLAVGRWSAGDPLRLQALKDVQGWWRSGDAASLDPELTVLGRRDGALQTGGETVFPEQLEARLQLNMMIGKLAPVPVLLLPEPDPEWGERLVALVGTTDMALIGSLQQMTSSWLRHERPKRWLQCPGLSRNAMGKWERLRWRQWLVGDGSPQA